MLEQSKTDTFKKFVLATRLHHLFPEVPFVLPFEGDLLEVSPASFKLKSLALLEAFGAASPIDGTDANRPDVIISTFSKKQTLQNLAKINVMYFDMDGTLVKEGSTVFDPETIRQLQRCRNAGVAIVLGPSGKPLAEFLPALESLPVDLDFSVLLEKGAYRLERGHDGTWNKTYLLTTPEMESSIKKLRDRFYPKAEEIEKSPGTNLHTIGARLEAEFGVVLVPAGSGAHESVLSFDILKGGSNRDFRNYKPGERDLLKIDDHALANRIVERFKELVSEENIPGLESIKIVDMMNFNIEAHDPRVDKNHAVRADILSRGKHVQALATGDSTNDESMLALPSEMPEQVQSGLILHRAQSADLISKVSYVAVGPHNARLFLKLVADAKAAADQEVVC